jgi:hypothetical protein
VYVQWLLKLCLVSLGILKIETSSKLYDDSFMAARFEEFLT